MKLFLLTTMLFFQSKAFASFQCFENEKDVTTKKIFTEQGYNQSLESWLTGEPEHPGYFQLWKAYNFYSGEKPTLNKIKGDKRKHCYIGCRMGQALPVDTAIYVAWYKEYQDLTDCERSTRFEVEDFDATLSGIDVGESSPNDTEICFNFCEIPREFVQSSF